MASEKRQTLSDVVASVISDTSDNDNITPNESFTCVPTDYGNSPTPIKLMKIRKYQLHPKTYSPKWELDPNYRGWVQRSKKGDGFYYCLACNQDYTCGKSELDKHASSRKHCMNVMSLPKQSQFNEMDGDEKSELKPCDGFMAENIVLDGQDYDASSTSGVYQFATVESKEEAFGKYIISELKRIKMKKTYELVKWEILQALQKAMLQEAETEDSED